MILQDELGLWVYFVHGSLIREADLPSMFTPARLDGSSQETRDRWRVPHPLRQYQHSMNEQTAIVTFGCIKKLVVSWPKGTLKNEKWDVVEQMRPVPYGRTANQ